MASICPLLTTDELSCQCQWVDEGKGIHSSVDVSLSGSKTWAFNEIGAKYTGFRLTVGGVSGEFATAQAALSVSACSQDWFFSNPTEMCPMTSVTSLATAQRFEHGQMIWIKELDKFYIFYDSGLQAGPTNLGIITGPLTLKPKASIDNRTGETPPPGFVEPVNNFGLIWRGEVEGYEDVRERLGWAKEFEFDFETIYQCEASCYDSSNCYLRSPEGKILNLYYMVHFGDYWQEESN
jgi:hypothetical protein